MSRTSFTHTVTALLLDAHKAGRGTAAQLLVDHDEPDALPLTVFAFKGDAQGRLAALAHNPERFSTVVRVTYSENAKGYANVATATDVELVSMVYRPRRPTTLAQHLGAYLQAWGQRLAA